MDNEKMNCMKLTGIPFFKHLFYEYYVYVDSSDYKADNIFLNKKIHVSIIKEWYHPNEKYWLVNVRVRKKDVQAFEDSMEQLAKKQLITGNVDYLDRADKMCNFLLKQAEGL